MMHKCELCAHDATPKCAARRSLHSPVLVHFGTNEQFRGARANRYPALAVTDTDPRRRDVERVELGLAHVGLLETDVRRLRAMLMMALADGSLRAHWNIVAPERANVIVLSADLTDQLTTLARNDRLVALLVGAADTAPPRTPTLRWPIRMEELLELLKRAEMQSFARSNDVAADHPLIRLADLLRPQSAASRDAWRITGLSRTPIYVAPARRQFFCAESLRTIHRFDVRNDISLAPVSLADLPLGQEQSRPIVMLQWSIGLLAGTLGPLPWINSAATLRLQRFPQFQILHHEPAHRRLAATFSRPVPGIDAAVELARLDRQTVCGFVNAADLCGYLRVIERATVPNNLAARSTRSPKRTLAQLLRRALGIEAATWQ